MVQKRDVVEQAVPNWLLQPIDVDGIVLLWRS
jgi:hypothetical protein